MYGRSIATSLKCLSLIAAQGHQHAVHVSSVGGPTLSPSVGSLTRGQTICVNYKFINKNEQVIRL